MRGGSSNRRGRRMRMNGGLSGFGGHGRFPVPHRGRRAVLDQGITRRPLNVGGETTMTAPMMTVARRRLAGGQSVSHKPRGRRRIGRDRATSRRQRTQAFVDCNGEAHEKGEERRVDHSLLEPILSYLCLMDAGGAAEFCRCMHAPATRCDRALRRNERTWRRSRVVHGAVSSGR